MGIVVSGKGDFTRSEKWLNDLKSLAIDKIFFKFGEIGVRALSQHTPIDSSVTAQSWSFNVVKSIGRHELQWTNSHINKGVPIAIILQYGHGTGTGGWVEGRDYINPALADIFQGITEEIVKEVLEL